MPVKNTLITTLSAKRNSGYKSPRDINLYDCELYKGRDSLFSYNYTEKNNIGNTRINLYEGTKLLQRDGTEIKRDVSDPLIASWRAYWKTDGSGQLYGNWLISGYVGLYDETAKKNIEIYLLDDATVYDYRN